jgi:CDP-paratose synthetase
MKIFVTGATGFIGKHLVRRLIRDGHKVTVNLYDGEKNPFNKNAGIYILKENNINKDIQFLEKENFDGIIHLASLYLADHKPEDAVKLVDSNLRFSTYMLECAAQSKVKWFINTGTFWQNYKNAEYAPVNLYAASKQAFESIAQYYIETDQIKFCTLRLSDTFGPDDTRPKIFNLWNKIAKSGETLDMSPGNQLIDISFIDDIVHAYLLLMNQVSEKRIKNGSVFAVKARKRYTLKELAKVFEKTTGQKLKINWGKRQYRKREVMVPWENGKIVPGWKTEYSIEGGIKKVFKKD